MLGRTAPATQDGLYRLPVASNSHLSRRVARNEKFAVCLVFSSTIYAPMLEVEDVFEITNFEPITYCFGKI